jgi:Domain of unknown function (DUF4129)
VTPVVRAAQGLSGLTREGARQAAQDELSRRPYREAEPSLLVRGLRRLIEALGRWLDSVPGVPGGRGGVVLLALLLALAVVVVAVRLGPLARGRAVAPVLDAGARLTLQGHREAAGRAAAEGRWADAVRERLRAVVRDLEQRGVLDARPGRTAGEVARDGGAALPALAADLQRGAAVFDEVWYGGRSADASSYAVLVEVDDRVTRTRATR